MHRRKRLVHHDQHRNEQQQDTYKKLTLEKASRVFLATHRQAVHVGHSPLELDRVPGAAAPLPHQPRLPGSRLAAFSIRSKPVRLQLAIRTEIRCAHFVHVRLRSRQLSAPRGR